MATNTPKLNLTKPDFTDVVDVTQLNSNMDILDDALAPTSITSPVAGELIQYDGTNWINAVVSGVPAGAVQAFAMSSAPNGFLKANGAAVSRATFSALFSAIGTTFGAGDGSTTFNVPDLRGEFPRGFDDGRGVDSGRAFGSAQDGAVQSHSHAFSVAQGGVGTFGLESNGTVIGFPGGDPVGRSSGFTIRTVSEINNNSAVVPSAAPTPNETRARNVALLYCIKF